MNSFKVQEKDTPIVMDGQIAYIFRPERVQDNRVSYTVYKAVAWGERTSNGPKSVVDADLLLTGFTEHDGYNEWSFPHTAVQGKAEVTSFIDAIKCSYEIAMHWIVNADVREKFVDETQFSSCTENMH